MNIGREDNCTRRTKTAAEFFAGIGLMRAGLEQAGWGVSYANDIDPQKLEIYAQNFSDWQDHFSLGDIHSIDASEIPGICLATASFPCTDLSLAGARDGLNGKHSSAFWGFARILREMGNQRPPFVLLENVTGLISSHKGQDFKDVLLALNELGYQVDALIVNASHFVPQSRERLFVVGTRGQPMLKSPDAPYFHESPLRPKALATFVFDHPEISWRFRDLRLPPPTNSSLPDIVEDIPLDDKSWWSAERRDYLISQMEERHLQALERMKNGERRRFGTVFRRVRKGRTRAELRTDGIAGCLRTPKGGSARQILVQAGRGEVHVRLLNPRECARLMGVNDFRIDVPLNRALFGFGDAVCVPVVAWLANEYLNPLYEELAANGIDDDGKDFGAEAV